MERPGQEGTTLESRELETLMQVTRKCKNKYTTNFPEDPSHSPAVR